MQSKKNYTCCSVLSLIFDVPTDVCSNPATWTESLVPTDLCLHEALAPEPDARSTSVLWRSLQESSHGSPRGGECGGSSLHSSHAQPAHGTAAGRRRTVWYEVYTECPQSSGPSTSVTSSPDPARSLCRLPPTAKPAGVSHTVHTSATETDHRRTPVSRDLCHVP